MSNFDYPLYNIADHSQRPEELFQTRREWLNQFGTGFGMLALATMLNPEMAGTAQAQSSGNPLAAKKPPMPAQAKAKRVLHIYMEGAMPHLDNWDPKPELMKKGKRGDNPGTKLRNRTLLAPQFDYKKFGQSGLELSEVWPNLGRHADDIAVVRSLLTDRHAS